MYSKEELKLLKKEFWEGFDIFCSNNKKFGVRKRKWILYDTKIKGLDLKFDATREGAFVILELNHRDKFEQMLMFEKLQKYKNIIRDNFEETLTWDDNFIRETGNNVCRIYVWKSGLDIHRRIHWMDFYRFMSDNMQRMETAFEDVKEMLK